MSIDPLANPHLVTPPYRVVPNRARRVFDSIPGEVPFARMLQAQNRLARIEPVDTFEPSAAIQSPSESPTQSTGPGLLPTLGEILPVEPAPRTQQVLQVQRQQFAPATGRVLDLYL